MENTERIDALRWGEEILWQLRAIALADVTAALQVVDGALEVCATRDMPPALRPAIAAIEKGPGGLKVKFYDKLKALELLGKCVGLFDRQALPDSRESALLRAIDESTRKEMEDGLQALQPQAAAGDDLVESARNTGA